MPHPKTKTCTFYFRKFVREMKASAEKHVTIIYLSTSIKFVAMHDGLLKLPHHEQALLTPAVHWETSPLHANPQPNN